MGKQQKIKIEPGIKSISGFDFLKKNERFFSLTQIEKFCGIPATVLSKYMTGQRKPAKHHIKKLDVFRDYLYNEIKQ